MIYLLDVNVLLALGLAEHEHHQRAGEWIKGLQTPHIATCSITELGFVRIASQAKPYGFSVTRAKETLALLISSPLLKHSFLADDQAASDLPAWVNVPRQTTDGHLCQLADAHGMKLATFDAEIPGSLFIPLLYPGKNT